MSMGATMSILGLWNNDHSIFDLMQLPEGFTEEDRETVTDSILTECAELEVLYPAPAVMKNCTSAIRRMTTVRSGFSLKRR